MSTGTGNRSTAGFTLLELLVVVVIGALILGATFQVLAVQERSYRHQGAAMTTQQNIRAALDVLESELREISASGGDLTMIQPESLTFRAYRAAGFICNLDAPGQRIVVVRQGTQPFVANAAQKQKLLYFVEGVRTTGTDDDWGVVEIKSVEDTYTCHGTWGSVEGTDTVTLNVPGFTFADAATGDSIVYLGAPVRSFEVFTYGLYTIDGEPVLARRDANGSLEPIIGPLAPSPSGLVFRYFDANGFPTTNPANVAQIGIVVRGRTQGTGVPGETHYTDSLTTRLFLRNN